MEELKAGQLETNNCQLTGDYLRQSVCHGALVWICTVRKYKLCSYTWCLLLWAFFIADDRGDFTQYTLNKCKWTHLTFFFFFSTLTATLTTCIHCCGGLHFIRGLSQNECKASCAASKFLHSFHFRALRKCAVVCFYECERTALPQHCWDLLFGQKVGKYLIRFFFFFFLKGKL